MIERVQEEVKGLSSEIRKLDCQMVRVDERLNGVIRIEKVVSDAVNLADTAEDKAQEAMSQVMVNTRDIQALETRFKWMIGLIAPFVLLILGEMFTK